MLYLEKTYFELFKSKISPNLLLFTGIVLLGLFITFPADLLIICLYILLFAIAIGCIYASAYLVRIAYAKLLLS